VKYSFMSFSTPELDLAGMLDAAKQYGYDALEPRLDSKHAHGIEVAADAGRRAALRDQAEEAGVALACLATSVTLADPEQTEENVRQMDERIDLAGDLGAPALRVFGGRLPDGLDRDRAIETVAEALKSVADHAGGRGVTVCVETHDDWCDPAHVAAALDRADHPNVAANWDIMHPVRTGHATIDQSFETLKPWIRHLHIHDGRTVDGKSELAPIGQGDIDHRRAIELLMTIDYRGVLSGEWIAWEPWDVHLPRELAALKGYERELGG